MMQSTILIIDDEKKLCSLLARIIGLEGFRVLQAYTAKEGLKLLKQEDVNVVISDVRLPDINGIELVKQMKQAKPYVEIINLTAYGTIQDGVLAIKNGAFDYITKGDDNEKIVPLVHKALAKSNLQLRLYQIETKMARQYGFDTIIGQSKAIKTVIELARKVAGRDTTVLLLGETGTGKEVFAQAIHYNSNRKTQNFVAINCSAFGKDLLESEMFGHKAGAFTGAQKDKKGLFEEADGGTLFLDEIGEMNVDLQSKLLRVIETGELIKVGDTRTQKINVRIIAATNRKLEHEIEKGNFREDLFYRLSVFQIMLPSLNERREDIPLLANHYLKEFSDKTNHIINFIDRDFMARLESHQWKGNIRELKNLIERSVILCEGDTLTPDLLPLDFYTDDRPAFAPFDMASIEKKSHPEDAKLYQRQ